ncbi:MAG TPA: hypothetical protein VHG29_04330 [Novosphingobium sp.]|nr:hypothetical protein [Novosphingobium sp.]
MRKLIAFSAILLCSAMPAHAQLIGGGLGGAVGGTLGGAGSIGSIGSPMDTLNSATSGTLRSSGSTRGSQSVNRKSGQVHADHSADANGAGDLSQVVSTPGRTIGGNAAGNGSASGAGNADAQLIGTDAIRGSAAAARGTASGAGSATGSLSGMLSGSGTLTGSGNVLGSGTGGGLAAGGSGTGAGDGALTVTKGTPVLAPDGERIGKVRQVIVDARGQVQQLLVKVDGETALLAASNFSANGNAVMSAMSEGQIKDAAQQQEAAKDNQDDQR